MGTGRRGSGASLGHASLSVVTLFSDQFRDVRCVRSAWKRATGTGGIVSPRGGMYSRSIADSGLFVPRQKPRLEIEIERAIGG